MPHDISLTASDTSESSKTGFYPWLVWGLAASFFFAEYFARVAPSVMVPELMRDFHVGGFALGSLSAFFLLSYIAMQLPVGALLDREGEYNRQDRKEEYNRQDRQGVLAGFRDSTDKIFTSSFVSFLFQ